MWPLGMILRPPGIVLQKEAAWAAGEVMASTGSSKWRPPSVEHVTHIWLGPQSWYVMHTSASLVVLPGGIQASVHCRSTSAGWPVELLSSILDLPFCGHVSPLSKD